MSIATTVPQRSQGMSLLSITSLVSGGRGGRSTDPRLAQQRYAKSHRILANCRGVKDFRRFRNSQDGTWFSRSVLGLTQPVHPHLFRHQMLTYLTSKGLTDAQIQLISGHESKKSLEIYQHLSLESVDKAYQKRNTGPGARRAGRYLRILATWSGIWAALSFSSCFRFAAVTALSRAAIRAGIAALRSRS